MAKRRPPTKYYPEYEEGVVYEVPDDECFDEKSSRKSTKDKHNPHTWADRRKMAYGAMVGIFVVTYYIMGPWMPLDRLEILEDTISWFYFAMVSVVGAYMGFKSWSTKT